MTVLYHVGISGGKDSAATLLWMIHESGIDPDNIRATFCDTDNEIGQTYEHVRMLNRRVHDIEWLSPKLGFYDLARKKMRFPSTLARFCTQHLKMVPTKARIDRWLDMGYEVVAVSGIRADESDERAKLSEHGDPMESYFGIREWRPLIRWKIEDVFLIHKKYGIPLNPLYAAGAQRVGCFPCIMSRKSEVRMIATEFPERIDKLRREESSVNSCGTGKSSFFPISMVPMRYRRHAITTKSGRSLKVALIDDVVEWSMTGKRAQGTAPDVDGLFDTSDIPAVCPSHWGACE